MWHLYFHMLELLLADKSVFDDYVPAVCVPLVNFMIKSPYDFKSTDFGKGTPLDLLFKFIQKIFKDGAELADEIHSMNAVALIIGVLEHLGEGQSQYIHTINEYYMSESQKAETQNYKYMLIQGLMMNFKYDQVTTIQSLQSLGVLDQVFDFILSNVDGMNADFEIKRLLMGLSTLALGPTSSQLPEIV